MLIPTGITRADYITALKSDHSVHVKMVFNSGTVLEDQDISADQGLVLTDVLNGDIDLVFGKAVMKQLTVGILNTDRVSGMNWSDTFELQFGVEVGGITNYVAIGKFIGKRPTKIKNTEIIEYTACDYMSKFDVLVDDFWSKITYPVNLLTLYHNLCNYVGVSYENGDELYNIKNRTFSAEPAQLQGYTCRDVLAWIAEACGCYAKIGANNKCKLVWYQDFTSAATFSLDDEFHVESDDLIEGFTWDQFDTYKWNDADKMLWSDVCGYAEAYSIDEIQVKQLGTDVDVVYPYSTNGNIYMIVENPFLSVESTSDITNYIVPLYDRLKSFKGHLPVCIECIGNYLIETGDIITVALDSTHNIPAPVFCRTLKFNGSCIDTYETTGNIERQDVSDESREKLIARNSIRFVASDLYYNIQSGIEIKSDGIEIDASKYLKMKSGSEIDVESGSVLKVKSGGDVDIESGGDFNVKTGGKFTVQSGNFDIDASGNVNLKGGVEITSGKDLKVKSGGNFAVESGGTFDVTATNFKIDSANKVLRTGEWQLDPNGIFFDNDLGTYDFRIQKGNAGIAGNSMGFIVHQFANAQGQITAVTKAYDSNNNLVEGYLDYNTIYESLDGTTYTCIFPDRTWSTNGSKFCIGLPSGKEFDNVFTDECHANYYCPDAQHGDLILCADGEDFTKSISLSSFYDNGYQQMWIERGSGIDNIVFFGNVSGIVLNRTTSVTDFNNLTETGSYWLNLSSMTGNRPSNMTSGRVLVVVNKYSNDIIQQIIYNTGVIDTRIKYQGTWEAWYKFTGTQV